ncbi:hypothetical protein D8674_008962 [Pyrus ussuriensis x Pyrus communis]|uniref:Myb-like domain-containing protein n=1 Tax=Pyrus ussuriensis x Pyrus communis TaxID=2448454 RepID=A0A5N5HXC0_9ROSA|nr:hypothetical protein D8674_008962 [Pyrus ussuriensis x Pyrus communis]
MASFTMKGRAWTRNEDEALCRAYRWVSKDSVRGSSQTSEGVWTRVSKKYLEFYEDITSPNTQNHKSYSSRWKKHLHPSLNKWHQALLAAASRRESGANYYDEGWVLFEDPSQHKVGPTPVFRTASSVVDMDEDGSPTIQQIRVENPSSGEGSIPRVMGRNRA